MLKKLQNILYENTGITEIEITKDTLLKNDLGLSSFDLAQLACSVEDEFDIEIPDRVIKDFKTVGDVIDYIKRNNTK